ncbi:MAG: secretion system protein, partial [Pseudonocardia sp.]|nr:secretion system protein [Pseudonocardia sp.]
RPPHPTLGQMLARTLDAPAPPEDIGSPRGRSARLVAPLVAVQRRAGRPGHRVVADLRVTGTPVAEHLARKALLALAGFVAPTIAQLLLAVAGLPFGIGLPLLGGVVLAVVGFVWPDLRARGRAAEMRAEFRHALSAYLDLVWITLAGGAGVDSALTGSVTIGQGWALDRLAGALSTAHLTRVSAWTALRGLGEEIGVDELAELAGSVSLAGTVGAGVRASLAARAGSLRAHQITDAEAAAQSATERMSLPVMLLFLGFLTFITYPAISQILDGL